MRKTSLGCITIICQRLNVGCSVWQRCKMRDTQKTIHPVNLKCGGIQSCSINKPCSNIKVMILYFWYKWLSTKILWYNHICVESRNLSLKRDAGKESLYIWDICMYIYHAYLFLIIVYESLSLAVAADSFAYYITYFHQLLTSIKWMSIWNQPAKEEMRDIWGNFYFHQSSAWAFFIPFFYSFFSVFFLFFISLLLILIQDSTFNSQWQNASKNW